MALTATLSFGALLRHLRKQAGMTQRDLAAALGYSESLICSLEKAQRLPDMQAVTERFIPALGLQDDPGAAAALIEQAALARGQRAPVAVTIQRTPLPGVQAEPAEELAPLPSLPTALIGRTVAVNQLCNRLLGHGGRLLTMVGPPGIGKTTLALAVAARLRHHFAGGVVFVPLSAISDAVLMASTVAAAVGCRDVSPKPPRARLIEFLRRRSMLLVLDNLEQIVDAAPVIGELVSECPGVYVLATSRERLHLRAEQRLKVPPLELPAAVELFAERAQSVDAGFQLTPQNQATVEAICQRLDGLPLALELCAAQVDLLTPAQLLAHLQERRLDLLVEGAHDLPPRQRSLRAAIDYSYTLLNEAERTLFRRLGVFAGGCDWEALAAVSTLDQAETGAQSLWSSLHALIGKSLVHTEPAPGGEQRFLLLETIAEFALEQVRSHGEEALLRQRHFATYLQLFRTGDNHLRGHQTLVWLARLKLEQHNLRAALQWALDTARDEDAAWLMLAASYFWNLAGFGYEEATWLARLLPHRQALAPDLRLAILLTFYRAAFPLAEFQPMERWASEVRELLEGCTDKLLQAAGWSWLAWTIADVDQSAAARRRGIAAARAAGEPPGLGAEYGAFADRDFVLANHLGGYAAFLIEQGELAQAAPILEESLMLAQRQGDRGGIGASLGEMGRVALLRGDLAQAHKLLHEAAAVATTVGYPAMRCAWQPLLGLVCLVEGKADEARRLLMESLQLALEVRNSFFLARICTYLAELALLEREIDQGAHWLAQSLAYHAPEQGITVEEVQRLWVAARLATAHQQTLRAAALFGLADKMHRQVHCAIGGPIGALAEGALASVCAALEPARFDEAFAAGRQMTLGEAFVGIDNSTFKAARWAGGIARGG